MQNWINCGNNLRQGRGRAAPLPFLPPFAAGFFRAGRVVGKAEKMRPNNEEDGATEQTKKREQGRNFAPLLPFILSP